MFCFKNHKNLDPYDLGNLQNCTIDDEYLVKLYYEKNNIELW